MSWENIKLGDWGAKEEKAGWWGAKTRSWGEKENTKGRETAAFSFCTVKADSDRIDAPCSLNDKESKQDPCKQWLGKQIFVNVWSTVRFEAKSIVQARRMQVGGSSGNQTVKRNFWILKDLIRFNPIEAFQEMERQLYAFWSKQHWLSITTVTERPDFF